MEAESLIQRASLQDELGGMGEAILLMLLLSSTDDSHQSAHQGPPEPTIFLANRIWTSVMPISAGSVANLSFS